MATKTTSVTERKDLDPLFLEPIQKILNELSSLYDEGYQSYGGERIAGFTDKQKELTQQLYDQVGAYGDDIRSGITTLKDAQAYKPQEWGQEAVDQYMNPYIGNVLDRSRKRAYDADDVAAQKRKKDAIAAGAFASGDRRFIEEQAAQASLEDRLLDNEAKLLHQGYTTAGDMFASDQDRALNAVKTNIVAAGGIGDLATTGQNLWGTQMAGAASAADAEQGMNQAGLDLAYSDFQDQRAYPYENLSYFMGGLQGFPSHMTPGQMTQTSTSPTMGKAGRAAGLGINLLGLYGMGGGFDGNFSMSNLFGPESNYWS